MLRWTTSHAIPTNSQYSCDQVETTSLGNSIFIVQANWVEETLECKITRFDTIFLESTSLPCELTFPDNSCIHNVGSHQDKLYIILSRNYNYMLYASDIRTMKFTKICDLGNNLREKVHFLGGYIYSIRNNEDRDSLSLVKVNLINMNVEDITLKEIDPRGYVRLFIKDDRLYLFTEDNDRNQKTYVIDEEVRLELSELDYTVAIWGSKFIRGKDMFVETPTWPVENPSLFTIDFTLKRWISRPMEASENTRLNEFTSYEYIDDTIYGLIRFYGSLKLEMRILELKPKLVDICLLQIVDRFWPEVDQKEMEDTLEKMPFPLRQKLTNMIEWRNR